MTDQTTQHPLTPDWQALLIEQLLAWWDRGHSDLPWRQSKDPYSVWVAEVMLQQTQIATVIPYYERWLDRFPTIADLADAALDDVLLLWQGLGYYSRARNLHAAARKVVDEYHGRLPADATELMKLPGIGRYTAGAIASIAFEQPAAVLDGNVIRVLSRLVDLADDVTRSSVRGDLWRLAEALVPRDRPGDFNQALMELGQHVCLPASPHCADCPLTGLCSSRARGTQYERPVRPPRKRTPHYDVVAGVIWMDHAGPHEPFLITRRPLEGMLGGLWEFPGGKVEAREGFEAALKREIDEELAVEIEPGRFLTEVRHAYTHFRITLHVYHAGYVSGDPQHIGVAGHAWVTMADLENYAFAVTDLRIIDALKQEFNIQ